MVIHVCVAVLVLCCLTKCASLASGTTEPSIFDCDEKLKMVRMELWAEKLNTKVETDLNNFAGELAKLQTGLDTVLSGVGSRDDSAYSKKNNVAFHVQAIDGQPVPGFAITFKKALENSGDAYNMETGCFTAPAKGTYWFSAHLCSNPGKCVGPSIFIRGKLAVKSYQRHPSDVPCDSVSTVSVLQAGDKVCLKASTRANTGSVHVSPDWLTNDFMGARVN